jgi:hypothetical protein
MFMKFNAHQVDVESHINLKIQPSVIIKKEDFSYYVFDGADPKNIKIREVKEQENVAIPLWAFRTNDTAYSSLIAAAISLACQACTVLYQTFGLLDVSEVFLYIGSVITKNDDDTCTFYVGMAFK